MDRSIRTTVYLDPEIKSLVDAEHLNLTQWVNENLERYFSVSSISDVDKEIRKLDKGKKILLVKRETLLASGMAETDEEALAEDVLKELQDNYKKRHTGSFVPGDEHVWITSPKNLKRLKQLGKEPDAFLKELETWFHGLQKD